MTLLVNVVDHIYAGDNKSIHFIFDIEELVIIGESTFEYDVSVSGDKGKGMH